MIAIADVLQAVEDKLKGVWPQGKVYQNIQPKDFERPSFLVRADKAQVALLNRDGVDITLGVVVSGWVELDEQQQSKGADLAARMARVLALFYGGYISVGERCPRVVKLEGQYQADCFVVSVQLNWGEDQVVDGSLPLMGEMNLNMQEG